MKTDSDRTIPLYFKVSPEEKAVIDEKMAQLGSAVYAADTVQADALIGELIDLLNQRSRACKLYK